MGHSEGISGIARDLLGNVAGLAEDWRASRRFDKTHARTQDAHERGWDDGHFDDPDAPRDGRREHVYLLYESDIADALAAFEAGGIKGLNEAFPPCVRSGVIFDAEVDVKTSPETGDDSPLT